MTLHSSLRYLLVLALAFTANATYADNMRGFFLGGGLARLDVESPVLDVDTELAEVLVGYKHNAWMGLELRYGEGLKSEKDGFKFDHYYAAYYRLEAVNDTGRFYLLAGYAETDFHIQGSEDDFSWGAGIGFMLTPKLNLNFEYKSLLDVEDLRFRTLSAHLDYRF